MVRDHSIFFSLFFWQNIITQAMAVYGKFYLIEFYNRFADRLLVQH